MLSSSKKINLDNSGSKKIPDAQYSPVYYGCVNHNNDASYSDDGIQEPKGSKKDTRAVSFQSRSHGDEGIHPGGRAATSRLENERDRSTTSDRGRTTRR
jgi:hypothetical protein